MPFSSESTSGHSTFSRASITQDSRLLGGPQDRIEIQPVLAQAHRIDLHGARIEGLVQLAAAGRGPLEAREPLVPLVDGNLQELAARRMHPGQERRLPRPQRILTF